MLTFSRIDLSRNMPVFAAVLMSVMGAFFVQGAIPSARSTSLGLPIRFTLPAPAYVTVVIEDNAGNRVRNLIAETLLPAGEQTLTWDGYDDGERMGDGRLVRKRVPPGSYVVRGLTHTGIRMRYEMTVAHPGSPPWATKDRGGAWLADHSPPADILHLPDGVATPNGKGKANFLVCSTSAEAGEEFVWLDQQGQRLYGTNDGFWGGTHLARDTGPQAVAEHLAYVFQSGQRDADNFTIEVRAIKKDDFQFDSVIKYPRPKSLRQFKDFEAYSCDGLAVHNGRAVFAVTMLNKLICVDVRTKKVINEITIDSPRAPTFDRQGRLYLISGNQVKRFAPLNAECKLTDDETVITKGLDEPRRLALDDGGNLLVSNWGRSHQVKVFDSNGVPLRTIGVAGGPKLGLYDPRRMNHPCGVATDREGRIWVAEGDFTPKRLSIWNSDGTFQRALYGPAKYGGGGTLDGQDKSRFYYDENDRGIEFTLDWATGTSEVKSIYWYPELTPEFETMPGTAPERSIYVQGRQYMVNCYNGLLRYNTDRGAGIWRMDETHIARPVAMIGNGADLVHHLWGWRLRHRDAIVKLWEGQPSSNVLFVWCDRNGDGVAQPDEIQWVCEDQPEAGKTDIGGIGLMPLIHSDLSFTTAFGTRVPAPTLDANGVPIYDLKKRQKVGDTTLLRSPILSGDRAITYRDRDDWWTGFDLRGGHRWQYPATPEQEIGGPGAMVAPTRLLGPAVEPKVGEAGPIVAINGEMGAVFLMTMDGLMLQTLGGDARLLPPLSEPKPLPGWEVKGISFQQEHFHPTINQTADGNVYLVVGFQQSSLLKLEGWDSAQRRDFGKLSVTETDLAGIPKTSIQSARKEGRLKDEIAILKRPLNIDGDLADWRADTRWLTIDAKTSAAVAVDREFLYVALRSGDAAALDNASNDYRYLFKQGGALDIMLGTNFDKPLDRTIPAIGDLRLVVARAERDGKTIATLYRPLANDKSRAALFESPIGKVAFEEVQAFSDKIRLAQRDGNFELAVPLNLLGFAPVAGREILADIGILRGKEGRTMQRCYWNNTDTVLISDLPSEARLRPERWGVWRFR